MGAVVDRNLGVVHAFDNLHMDNEFDLLRSSALAGVEYIHRLRNRMDQVVEGSIHLAWNQEVVDNIRQVLRTMEVEVCNCFDTDCNSYLIFVILCRLNN